MISNKWEWLTCMQYNRINYIEIDLYNEQETKKLLLSKKKINNLIHVSTWMQIIKLLHAEPQNSCKRIPFYNFDFKINSFDKTIKANFTNCNMLLVIHMILLSGINHWVPLNNNRYSTQQQKTQSVIN